MFGSHSKSKRLKAKLTLGFLLGFCLSAKAETKPTPVQDPRILTFKSSHVDLTIKDLSEPQGYIHVSQLASDLNRRLKPNETCRKMVSEYVVAQRELYDIHAVNQSLLGLSYPTEPGLLELTEEQCDELDSRKLAVQTLTGHLTLNSGKIGVLLPMTGPNKDMGTQILKGIYTSLQTLGKNPEDIVVVRDTDLETSAAQKHLAELVVQHQIAALIGGANTQLANFLAQWAERLHLPTLILSGGFVPSPESRYVFRVFPTETSLAGILADAAAEKGFKRIAILKPQETSAERVTFELQKALNEKGIKADLVATYQTSNYQSMEEAARTIFKVQKGGRTAELAMLVNKMRQEAKEKGYGFNLEMVMLPPIIDFDALFIPDNFKAVRHFVQIFKYLGVKKLTMIGNHQWRSPALITPYDPFLEGSFFTDFIGSYYDLPRGIHVRTSGSQYFTSFDDARNCDYNLIGLHSMNLLSQALELSQVRYKLARILHGLEIQGSTYFKRGPAFKQDRTSQWPAFILGIHDQKIELLSSPKIPSSM